ncbi:unnamed protein product, partial [Rotaria sp. Silwood1]
LDAFDRGYNNVFQQLNDKQRQRICDFDKYPSLAAGMCRRLFSLLELGIYLYNLFFLVTSHDIIFFVGVVCHLIVEIHYYIHDRMHL